MKKCIIMLIVISLCFTLSGCGEKTVASVESQTQTSAPSSDVATTEKTTSPDPAPMDVTTKKLTPLCGKDTGTRETYTGFEPLPKRNMPIVDPDNIRKLSTEAINHSFGVSKNGVPHEISLNNQKIYEKHGGVCLDMSGKKVIYLTFDCGYENGNTEKILDTLKEKGVTATFFVTLDYVESSPELVARMIKEGHIVGNHSAKHKNFSKISRTEMVEEIESLDNHLRERFGYSAPFFRFPEGACSESALDMVQNLEFKSVFWSSAYADWDTSVVRGKQYAVETVTQRLHPGCILLLHSVSKDNAEAMGDIIDQAREQGYEFKALSDM